MRSLIVDDSSSMRRIIINTLNKLGCRDVGDAGNGHAKRETWAISVPTVTVESDFYVTPSAPPISRDWSPNAPAGMPTRR
jgi:hypothetical protein